MNEQEFKKICYDKTEKFIKSLHKLENSKDFFIIVGVKLINKYSENKYTFEYIDDGELKNEL